MEGKSETQRTYDDIAVINAEPTLTAERFVAQTKNVQVIILIAYASGTTPEWLNTAIKSRIDSGIPIFLVSRNPGDTHGILNARKYAPQTASLEAGAIALQSVNVNNLQEILNAVQDELDSGKRGQELARRIKKQFEYQSPADMARAILERK